MTSCGDVHAGDFTGQRVEDVAFAGLIDFVRFDGGYRVAERFFGTGDTHGRHHDLVHTDRILFHLDVDDALAADGNGLVLHADEREDQFCVFAGRYAVCTGCICRGADGGAFDDHCHAGDRFTVGTGNRAGNLLALGLGKQNSPPQQCN